MTATSTNASNSDAAAGMGSVYVSLSKPVLSAVYVAGFLNVLYKTLVESYNIRMYALEEYGLVIHEFDPYFNYRATEVRKQKRI